jgi:hypothetical protein
VAAGKGAVEGLGMNYHFCYGKQFTHISLIFESDLNKPQNMVFRHVKGHNCNIFFAPPPHAHISSKLGITKNNKQHFVGKNTGHYKKLAKPKGLAHLI